MQFIQYMVFGRVNICPDCGGKLKHYDKVKRKTRGRFGKTTYYYIQRYRCVKCGKIHRRLIKNVPYKHYESWIIFGVIDGTLDYFSEGFEDFPCENTMKQWIKNADVINRFRTF